MNNDHSATHDHEDASPPDRAAAGDVSTTGVSSHDADDATHVQHGLQPAGSLGAHDDDDAPDVPTLVPTNWKQLILPALILLLVGILVAGPLMNAFAPRPAAPATNENAAPAEVTATPAHEGSAPATQATQASTEAAVAAATATAPLFSPTLNATRTAVALAGERGEVARVPVQLAVGGSSFVVKPGSNLLPDWKPSDDVGIATWLEGTVANHVLYVPFTSENATLFADVKPGTPVNLTMNTGQVFVFVVTRAQRAANGPATSEEEFTVTSAMRQDHAGVTLFLIGDPATDRAVVQADFTGTIQ